MKKSHHDVHQLIYEYICYKHFKVHAKYPQKSLGTQRVPIDLKSILWMFGEAMFYQTQMPIVFLILFFDIGQCFCPAQKRVSKIKKSATLG